MKKLIWGVAAGTLLLSSVMIVLGNLLSDILVACLDPRIKFE